MKLSTNNDNKNKIDVAFNKMSNHMSLMTLLNNIKK